MITGKFPSLRQQRLRSSSWIRKLVEENSIYTSDLILPLFVREGKDILEEIPGMRQVFRYSIDTLLKVVSEAIDLQIPAVAVFPCIPSNLKTVHAEEAYNPDNLICRTVSAIKSKFGNKIGVITDVALDPYTTHGHDGIFENGTVNNDATIEILCKQSLVQAASGADVIAPSDMMDGRIKSIRHALHLGNFDNVIILSYSAKYCSYFYSPFREAIGICSTVIDKSSYQMDFRNSKEAMLEIALDIKEGADIIMIKPAMMYGDIVKEATQNFQTPVFAYQVSGEYRMISNFGINGILESLICIKRAGARGIFTYGAIEVAKSIF